MTISAIIGDHNPDKSFVGMNAGVVICFGHVSPWAHPRYGDGLQHGGILLIDIRVGGLICTAIRLGSRAEVLCFSVYPFSGPSHHGASCRHNHVNLSVLVGRHFMLIIFLYVNSNYHSFELVRQS